MESRIVDAIGTHQNVTENRRLILWLPHEELGKRIHDKEFEVLEKKVERDQAQEAYNDKLKEKTDLETQRDELRQTIESNEQALADQAALELTHLESELRLIEKLRKLLGKMLNRSLKKLGETCDEHYTCVSGLICVSNTCHEPEIRDTFNTNTLANYDQEVLAWYYDSGSHRIRTDTSNRNGAIFSHDASAVVSSLNKFYLETTFFTDDNDGAGPILRLEDGSRVACIGTSDYNGARQKGPESIITWTSGFSGVAQRVSFGTLMQTRSVQGTVGMYYDRGTITCTFNNHQPSQSYFVDQVPVAAGIASLANDPPLYVSNFVFKLLE